MSRGEPIVVGSVADEILVMPAIVQQTDVDADSQETADFDERQDSTFPDLSAVLQLQIHHKDELVGARPRAGRQQSTWNFRVIGPATFAARTCCSVSSTIYYAPFLQQRFLEGSR